MHKKYPNNNELVVKIDCHDICPQKVMNDNSFVERKYVSKFLHLYIHSFIFIQ